MQYCNNVLLEATCIPEHAKEATLMCNLSGALHSTKSCICWLQRSRQLRECGVDAGDKPDSFDAGVAEITFTTPPSSTSLDSMRPKVFGLGALICGT